MCKVKCLVCSYILRLLTILRYIRWKHICPYMPSFSKKTFTTPNYHQFDQGMINANFRGIDNLFTLFTIFLTSNWHQIVTSIFGIVQRVSKLWTGPDFRQLGWLRFTEHSNFRHCLKSSHRLSKNWMLKTSLDHFITYKSCLW